MKEWFSRYRPATQRATNTARRCAGWCEQTVVVSQGWLAKWPTMRGMFGSPRGNSIAADVNPSAQLSRKVHTTPPHWSVFVGSQIVRRLIGVIVVARLPCAHMHTNNANNNMARSASCRVRRWGQLRPCIYRTISRRSRC